MAKPATLANLEKNKLIDVQANFVDTFNWIKDFCNNIEAKKPLKLDLTNDSHPIIKLTDDIGALDKVICVDKDGEKTENKERITQLTFKSGEDSNLSFRLEENLSGNVDIVVDVYYK